MLKSDTTIGRDIGLAETGSGHRQAPPGRQAASRQAHPAGCPPSGGQGRRVDAVLSMMVAHAAVMAWPPVRSAFGGVMRISDAFHLPPSRSLSCQQ